MNATAAIAFIALIFSMLDSDEPRKNIAVVSSRVHLGAA